MKITERFNIDATQFEIDFVDIDTDRDTPLFFDPFFLGNRKDYWSVNANRTLKNFFQTFIGLINDNNINDARMMFNYLHEPNETCLGLSVGRPKGNAIGRIDGDKLFNSIAESAAVETGIIEDLEDFRLFISGIDKDKISDMTTNIIRKHLIEYTQSQCDLWKISTQSNVASGFYWDRHSQSWANEYTNMLIIDGKKILLSPKSVVSYAKRYAPRKYYDHFVLNFLQHEHLRTNSALVRHRRRSGEPYVTKKSLKEGPAPFSKDFIAGFTERHPEVFREFKDWMKHSQISLPHDAFSDDDPRTIAHFLSDKLRDIPSGSDAASTYHRTIVGILDFIFYPDLTSPIVEREINQGRKRIDLTFDNAAINGFFFRLHTTYQTPSQFIIVECKNYSKDVANPELDQICGRFNINTGKVGILACRQIDDMELFLQRCNDAYQAQRGIVLPLVDDDLTSILDRIVQGYENPYENLLADRFRDVALR